jgi:hypothetical protein
MFHLFGTLAVMKMDPGPLLAELFPPPPLRPLAGAELRWTFEDLAPPVGPSPDEEDGADGEGPPEEDNGTEP